MKIQNNKNKSTKRACKRNANNAEELQITRTEVHIWNNTSKCAHKRTIQKRTRVCTWKENQTPTNNTRTQIHIQTQQSQTHSTNAINTRNTNKHKLWTNQWAALESNTTTNPTIMQRCKATATPKCKEHEQYEMQNIKTTQGRAHTLKHKKRIATACIKPYKKRQTNINMRKNWTSMVLTDN